MWHYGIHDASQLSKRYRRACGARTGHWSRFNASNICASDFRLPRPGRSAARDLVGRFKKTRKDANSLAVRLCCRELTRCAS